MLEGACLHQAQSATWCLCQRLCKLLKQKLVLYGFGAVCFWLFLYGLVMSAVMCSLPRMQSILNFFHRYRSCNMKPIVWNLIRSDTQSHSLHLSRPSCNQLLSPRFCNNHERVRKARIKNYSFTHACDFINFVRRSWIPCVPCSPAQQVSEQMNERKIPTEFLTGNRTKAEECWP